VVWYVSTRRPLSVRLLPGLQALGSTQFGFGAYARPEHSARLECVLSVSIQGGQECHGPTAGRQPRDRHGPLAG
jgi:hypothetical protein